LAKDGVILFNISYSSENTDGIYLTIADIIGKTPFTVMDCLTWKKKSAIPNNRSSNKVTRICEFVFVIARKSEKKTFMANKKITSRIERTGQANYENIFNFIEASNNDGSYDLNKATYSSDLVEKLISMYIKEGSTIYDPFMGTGTTAVAAYRKGCKCIGSELSEAQVKFALKRIRAEVKESKSNLL
jgi:DNA modification methylase